MAITWVTLAITGLILSLGKAVLLPLIGYTLFSWLATLAKNVHNFIGPILIVAVPWMFVRFVRDNGIGAEDFKWFAQHRRLLQGPRVPVAASSTPARSSCSGWSWCCSRRSSS